MATPEVPYASLRNYLAGRKEASVTSPPSADSVIPDDKGKAPTTGARFEENASDVKKMPPGVNAEHGAENPHTCNAADPVPNSGLEQTTADEGDSQTRAIETVKGENEKMSGLDPTKDADLDQLMARLTKAAEQLPALVGATRAQPAQPAQGGLPASADHQAVANTVEAYRKMGADRGRVIAAYLLGFDETAAFLKKAADEGTLEQMLQGAGGAPGADAGTGGGAQAPAPGPEAGPPGGAAPGGGDPGAAAMGMGGGGEGQMTDDDLLAAFAEAGISPEEFVQMLTQMKGQMGGGGAGPGAGPEMPPDQAKAAAAAIEDGIKIAQHVVAYKKSGKFSFKPAADGTPARRGRDQMKAYLLELRAAGA
jgi:hypothetical protein